MKSTLKLVLTLSLTALVAQAFAGSDEDTLKGLYSKLTALTLKKDYKTMKKYWYEVTTKDVVYLTKNPQTGKPMTIKGDDYIKQAEQMFAMTKSIDKAANKITKITKTATGYTVFVTTEMGMTMAGQDGKMTRIMVTGKSEDTWVKQGSSLKLKQLKSLGEKITPLK